MTRGVWGEREERWLRERYAYEHAPQLVAEFEREFGKKVSKGALYTRANKLGLLKMARDLPPNMALRRSQRRCPRRIEELRGCTVEYHKRWRERHGID